MEICVCEFLELCTGGAARVIKPCRRRCTSGAARVCVLTAGGGEARAPAGGAPGREGGGDAQEGECQGQIQGARGGPDKRGDPPPL
eukprot:685481-Prorocentrum_minimum.AAC.1